MQSLPPHAVYRHSSRGYTIASNETSMTPSLSSIALFTPESFIVSWAVLLPFNWWAAKGEGSEFARPAVAAICPAMLMMAVLRFEGGIAFPLFMGVLSWIGAVLSIGPTSLWLRRDGVHLPLVLRVGGLVLITVVTGSFGYFVACLLALLTGVLMIGKCC